MAAEQPSAIRGGNRSMCRCGRPQHIFGERAPPAQNPLPHPVGCCLQPLSKAARFAQPTPRALIRSSRPALSVRSDGAAGSLENPYDAPHKARCTVAHKYWSGRTLRAPDRLLRKETWHTDIRSMCLDI